MKRKISKDEFEKLHDSVKAEYEEKNGNYFLKIADDDDAIEELRQAKKNANNELSETKKKMQAIQDKLDEMTMNTNKKDGNIEAIESSYKDKINNLTKEYEGKITKLTGVLGNSVVDTALSSLAAKIIKPDSHGLFMKSAKDRIVSEFVNDKPVLRILDKEGKPSAMTLEDFEKEIVADKGYSSILVGSRANGAQGNGISRVPGSGGSLPLNSEGKPIILATMNPHDLADHIKTINKQE